MSSIEKLFKAVRSSSSKGVKRHLTYEIMSTYCGVPGLVKTLLVEAFFLSESASWEDRVAASKIVEEMARVGTLPDAFSREKDAFVFGLERAMQGPKYLASFYTEGGETHAAKDYIDLEDHNVVLSLSNLTFPGMAKKENTKQKRQKEKHEEEKREVESPAHFYKLLCKNLSSFEWEKRHGAAQTILGLVRGMQGREAHVHRAGTLDGHEFLRALLTTLIMDRFNDYEMDVAVSPVRETVGRALREMCSFLSQETVSSVLLLLVKLGDYEDWQVKYSGLIGIKAVLTPECARTMPKIVQSVGTICLSLLVDLDEDVKGVSASILTEILSAYTTQDKGNEKGVSVEKGNEKGVSVGVSESEDACMPDISEVIDIEDTVETCWSALEEEEDLAAAKAKIIGLLEKIQGLGFSLGKMEKKRYTSVLSLLRNPIDTVKLAVLSLLSSLPVVCPCDALSAVLFGVMMEEEEEIRSRSKELVQKIARHLDPHAEKTEKILRGFLSLIVQSSTHGSALPGIDSLIVVGETDLCTTDAGCKAAGEERVLEGRTAALLCILSVESFSPVVGRFFTEETCSSLPYFVLCKAVSCVFLSLHAAAGGREWGARLAQTFLGEGSAVEENKGDLNRSAYALARLFEGVQTEEDAASLIYLFNIRTHTPLLRMVALALSLCPARFESVLHLGVECVVKGREEEEKEEEKEKEKEKEEGRTLSASTSASASASASVSTSAPLAPAKRVKLSEDAAVLEKEPWRLLSLFEVLGDVFLATETFAALKRELRKCVEFLRPTIAFFQKTEELCFVFDTAVEERAHEVVGHLITQREDLNEDVIVKMVSALQGVVEDRSADHTPLLGFFEKILPFSRVYLLTPLVSPLVQVVNTHFSAGGIRESASKAFSAVVPAIHLRGPVQCARKDLARMIEGERERIDKMLQPEDMSQVQMNVVLREYQRKGVEWIAFLKKSGLSGILCDDMGLGKTIQVLAFLSHEKAKGEKKPFNVLVLCPTALTGYWHSEISLHFPGLTSGSILDAGRTDLCVASYDKFRVNWEMFAQVEWFYLVLDEGHVIRNANTLLHTRVKKLRTQHRLLLSGTPIQNSVNELWALFDILMPGYLGSEKDFAREYLKPIQRGREGKGTIRDAELAKTRLEDLHKMVLPFMLRRMKEMVLSDLPPKVIKDVYVQMEEAQKCVYEALAEQGDARGEYGGVSSSSSNFGLLSKLVKACSHPALLAAPDLARAKLTLKEAKASASGKVHALLDLLHIMVQTSKILVFCQYKGTIDLLSKSVSAVFPEMKWCRLDGTVKGEERAALARKFNADPEMAVMYLTTHAGGLGLNLTGADAVIFFEHDWNPMMDLQAMDRAHRLGQKKSVNVFRLITKETIEESIMSLQRFKKYVASIVVNQQNVEIETMDTSGALERLAKEEPVQQAPSKTEEYEDFI
ncbi:TATA-binding protein-associated factor [Nematocida sp. AWRm77]|nr:TATA-binding protein-associated factor [Nematocida sp. AWRm77]